MSNTKTTIIDAMNAYFDAKAGKTPDSNAKHTPGPWLPECHKGKKFSLDGWYVFAGNATLAIIYGNTPEEAEANAKLIAAAPEMLDCLQRALTQFERDYNEAAEAGREPQTPFWVMDANNIIKKDTP